MSYQSNKMGDPNNLGFFATSAALEAAYPVGAPGYFALVGDTDSFWVWDSGTSQWIDSKSSGTTAYVYIAYASDAIGTDFTMTFNPALDYIAIKNTTVAIPSPSASDFTGLWKNYAGIDGASFIWRGTYSGSTAYAPNDAVYYLGSSYMCKLASTGNLPTDTTYFDLMAQKGANGAGSGDVVGPASAVDSNIAAFDTTTGKLIKDSGKKVEAGVLNNSDAEVPTSKLVKDTLNLYQPTSVKDQPNGYAGLTGSGLLKEAEFPGGSGAVTTASGILTGGLLSINADPTKFDISDGSGWIVDNWTNPNAPVSTKVIWTGKTAITDTYRTTDIATTVLIDSSGNVVQKNTPPSRADYRDYIVIGKSIHPTLGNITSVSPFQRAIPSADLIGNDLADFIGVLAQGVEITANGANLNLNRSSGSLLRTGSNYPTSVKDPNVAAISSGSAISFQYRYRNGSGGFKADAATTSVIPNAYDDGSGTLASIGGTSYIINRIYVFTNGNTFIVPGQSFYATQSLARDAIATETPILDPQLADASLRAFLITRGNATDLSISLQALFISGGKFGQASSSGGGSATPGGSTGSIQWNNAGVFDGATVNGLVKSNGTTAPVAAVADTDFAAAPTSKLAYSRDVTCRVATTANITLSNTQTIDGVALSAGDYVLVKNQSTASQNGVYVVVSGGAWTRATEYSTTLDFDKKDIFISEGTTNLKTWWLSATKNVTVGTTAVTFAQIPNGIGTGADQAAAGNHSHTSIATTSASSSGAAWSERYTSRTATASTATTDLVVRFSGSTASQIETMPDGVAVSNNSGRVIRYVNNATVAWILRQSASNSLDGATADLTILPGQWIQVYNIADNAWITVARGVISAVSDVGVAYTPAAAGTSTLDLAASGHHDITMPAGNITIAISNATTRKKFLVSITQDGTGSRTVTWFSTIRWVGGSAPTLTTTASKRDVFGFIATGTNTFDGFVVGQNI